MALSKPIIKKYTNSLKFEYTEGNEKGTVVRVKNYRRDRNDNIVGTLSIQTSDNDLFTPIKGIDLTLNSLRSRSSIINDLTKHDKSERDNTFWDSIINDIANRTLHRYRPKNEIEEIWPDSEASTLEYLVYPVLPKGAPTICFGEGGAGKGLLAALFALILQVQKCGDKLGLTINEEPSPVLYLDWEFNRDELIWRWSALFKGFKLKKRPIDYLECSEPLIDMADGLKEDIKSYGYKLIIIDSVLGAIGDNPNEAEPVLRLMNTIRSFKGVTALIIAHTSKDKRQGQKTPYGSVFYTNLSRSVWQCIKKQKAGEDEMVTELYHMKTNRSKLELPIGLRWNFTDDKIFVNRCEVKYSKQLNTPTMGQQIINLINSKGKMRVKDIALELGKGPESIRVTLRKMEGKGEVKHFPDKTWGLSKTK